jgi:hypothetical protein
MLLYNRTEPAPLAEHSANTSVSQPTSPLFDPSQWNLPKIECCAGFRPTAAELSTAASLIALCL